MSGRAISVLCGTFLISFSLLSFEITTIRTINSVVGPSNIYSAIAIAMLGLSAAGAVFSLIDIRTRPVSRDKVLTSICVGIAASLVLCQFLAAEVKGDINTTLEAAGRAGGWPAVATQLIGQSLFAAIKIGGVLLLPYFLFLPLRPAQRLPPKRRLGQQFTHQRRITHGTGTLVPRAGVLTKTLGLIYALIGTARPANRPVSIHKSK